MTSLWADFRYAVRRLIQEPGLAVVVTVVLGLGIGANSTVFSMVKSLLLPDLPIRDQENVVLLWSVNSRRGLDRTTVSPGDFADLRTRARSFAALAAHSSGNVHLTGATEPVRLNAERVTTNFFSLLGVQPVLGRGFTAEDADAQTVVISHNSWRNFFESDVQIIGKAIQVDGEPHTVIGVTGPEFWFLSRQTGLWLPMRDPTTADSRDERSLVVVGRLGPGTTLEDANTEALVIASQMAQEYPETNSDWGVEVTGAVPLRPQETVVIALLLVVVFLVLAIACANIANLLLARAVGRRREIAVRSALGAGSSRILRQLLVESLLYASLGAAFGLALTTWSTDLVRRSAESPFLQALTVDKNVLVFTAAAALVSTLLFGLTPALHSLKANLTDALKSGARLAGDGGNSLRTTLMVGQVAAATLLLIVAGLVLRTTLNYRAVSLGFRTDNVLTLRVDIPEYKYHEPRRVPEAHEAFLRGLRELPEVQFAGAGSRLPAVGSRNNSALALTIAGRPQQGQAEKDWAVELTVSTGYFEALEIPLQRGRAFSSADTPSAPLVAVISQTMALRYWGQNDPIGRQLRIDNPGAAGEWITVVGVVADVRNEDAAAPARPAPLPASQPASLTHDDLCRAYATRAVSGRRSRAIRHLESRSRTTGV